MKTIQPQNHGLNHGLKSEPARAPHVSWAVIPLLLLGIGLLMPELARAEELAWTGRSSGYWRNPVNWEPIAIPQTGDDLVFPFRYTPTATTNNFDPGGRLRSITIYGPNYALRGTPILLNGRIATLYGAGESASVDLDITFQWRPDAAMNCGFSPAYSDSILYVTGDLDLLSSIMVTDRGNVLLGGAISGTGGITKYGNGYLRLYGSTDNTYTGTTRLISGTLELGKTGANAMGGDLSVGDSQGTDIVRWLRGNQLPDTTTVTVYADALLDLDNFNETIGGLVLRAGKVETGSGTLTLNGGVTAGDVVGVASIRGKLALGAATRTFEVLHQPDQGGYPQLRVHAAISGAGGLMKTGGGYLSLAGSNTYRGLTTVGDGTLIAESDAALGDTTRGTVVQAGGALYLSNVQVGEESLTVTGSGHINSSALMAFGLATNSWGGPVTFMNPVGIYVNGRGWLRFSGPMDGAGGPILTGPGTVVFSGTRGNTYTGETVVNQGALELGKTAGTGVAIRYGTLYIGDGVGGAQADVVRFLANNQLWSTVPVVITNSGWLDLNNYNDTVGDLTLSAGRIDTGTGLLTLAGDVSARPAGLEKAAIHGRMALSGAIRTFEVTSGGQPVVPEPVLQMEAEISGPAGLHKTGDATLALRGANSYSGLTTVAEGVLMVLADTALGTTAAGTIVHEQAILTLGSIYNRGIHVGDEALTLRGWLSAAGGFDTSNSWSGPITLAANVDISVRGNGFLNLSGPITGPGGFTKGAGDSGTLILSGADANAYAGATSVRDGTLVLAKSETDGAIPGLLGIGSDKGGTGSAVVRLQRPNQIANNSSITITASGRFDLNGYYDRIDAVTGNGSVALGSGHLIAGHSGSSFTFDGRVSGTGYLWKVGGGTWTLTADNTYSGTTRIEAGTLLVNGMQAASDIEIQSHGVLGGAGIVGHITSIGGAISPGSSSGMLTSSNILLDAESDFVVELTSAGADQLNARGKVALGNARLILAAPGLMPTEGQEFIILKNDGTDAIIGTFAGLLEGTRVTAGPCEFRITYAGGTGNDVGLIATNTAALWPALTIRRTATNTVVVSWPQTEITWFLQKTTNLGAMPVLWSEIPPPYLTSPADYFFTEPASVGNMFYRLSKP